MYDEGPSADDIARFSDTEGYCPDCGEPVYDNAEACPYCRSMIGGRVLSEPPMDSWLRDRWKAVVAIVTLLAFMSGVLLWLL